MTNKNLYKLIPLAAAVAFFMGTAHATPFVNINSVVGLWTSTVPGSPDVTGQGTNEIRWGSSSPQSGYKFTGIAPPPVTNVALESEFKLGDFTHYNFPIYPPSLTSAILKVTTDLLVDDGFGITQNVLLDSFFTFYHDETPNERPCLPGSVSVCDDEVTFAFSTLGSTSFILDGTEYFVDINGFHYKGADATSFLTEEGKANVAELRGIVTSTPGGGGPDDTIPEPASLALLGIGLAGLAGNRRRQRAG